MPRGQERALLQVDGTAPGRGEERAQPQGRGQAKEREQLQARVTTQAHYTRKEQARGKGREPAQGEERAPTQRKAQGEERAPLQGDETALPQGDETAPARGKGRGPARGKGMKPMQGAERAQTQGKGQGEGRALQEGKGRGRGRAQARAGRDGLSPGVQASQGPPHGQAPTAPSSQHCALTAESICLCFPRVAPQWRRTLQALHLVSTDVSHPHSTSPEVRQTWPGTWQEGCWRGGPKGSRTQSPPKHPPQRACASSRPAWKG